MRTAASMARALRAGLLRRTGASRLARRRLDGSRAAVLNYHRVIDAETARRDAVEEGMFVTPETFARHLDCLVAHFRVLPLHEIVERTRRGAPLPQRACAITFDDGWRDNLVHALPALASRAVPATLFVVTGRMGTSGAFWADEVCRIMRSWDIARQRRAVSELGADPGGDPTYALLELLKDAPRTRREEAMAALRAWSGPSEEAAGRLLLDWDELDRMAATGVDIEAHGVTHDMLTGLPDEDVRRELVGSRDALRARGHGRHGLFAYPAGRYDARVGRLTAEAGFEAAFTIERRLMGPADDPFALPRLMLHEGMSASEDEFLMRVPGWA